MISVLVAIILWRLFSVRALVPRNLLGKQCKAHCRHFVPRTRSYLSLSHDAELDDDSKVPRFQSPDNMQDVLKSLLDISAGPSGPVDDVAFKQPSMEDMQRLVSKLENIIVENEGPDALTEDENDAPYLDAETYGSFRSIINMDGSLNPSGNSAMGLSRPRISNRSSGLEGLVNPTPELPASYYKQANTDATLEDLFQTRPPSSNEVDEDVHNQIMAQESGFQKQSSLFQSYLSGDVQGEDFTRTIREERRKEEERDILLKLEQEMAELEDTLEKEPMDLNIIVCSKCKCTLSQAEIEMGPSERICRSCLGDMIAETSDMSFLNASPTPFMSARNNYRPTSPATQPRRVETPVPDRPQVSFVQNTRKATAAPDLSRKISPQGYPATKDEVSLLKHQVAALQQQVENYKLQVETADRQARRDQMEISRLRQLVVQLEDALDGKVHLEGVETLEAPWMQVVDPDTGEIFYWNEETEEIRWDMDDVD